MAKNTIKTLTRQVSVTQTAQVPAVIESAGPRAKKRFVEFFTANINNDNTRAAYLRAVRRFCSWCDVRKIDLTAVEPTLVALYINELQKELAKSSVKQHLAAIRMLFDYFVTGHVVDVNPASSVRGPKLVIKKGKTPVMSAVEARQLMDAIDLTKISGLRDRALIALMIYTFARVSATISLDVKDVCEKQSRLWVRLHEKGGRFHEMPLHHNAELYLREYMAAATIEKKKNRPLFCTLDRHRKLTTNRLQRQEAWEMVKRRARQAGVSESICNHTFRATGITDYMRNGGTLEKAQQMAAHANAKTTNMYNRVEDEVTLDEVERMQI